MKGDTVSNVTKPATLETGAVVQVPLFVNVGRPRQGRPARAALHLARVILELAQGPLERSTGARDDGVAVRREHELERAFEDPAERR